MKSQVQAVLIHHRLPAREPNRQQLRDLCEQLKLPLIDIVDQPSLVADRITVADGLWLVGRYCLKSAADGFFQWRSGRDSFPTALRRGLLESCRSLHSLLRATREARVSAYRTCLVERVLVHKHMAAWQVALESDSDWLIVFEDDAQIQAETKPRLQHFVATELSHYCADRWIYCDLAGGYEIVRLLPSNADWDPVLQCWCLPHIRTNTLCSYLISRQLMVDLLWVVQRFPLLRELPADHLINLASLLAQRKQEIPRCLHWRDPYFRHGSFQTGLASTVSGVR